MSQPRRRISKTVLSLTLTATMVAGLGYGVAGASNFDVAKKPLDLGNPEIGMTIERSQSIAHQLRPVPLKLKLKEGPRPAMPKWIASTLDDDPFMKDDAWRYVRKGYKQGQVIRKRESVWSKAYFPGSRAIQYAFVSYDSRGYPMTATATLVVPPHAKENAGIVQWNQFINSSGPKCKVTTQLNQPDSWGVVNSPIQIMTALLIMGHPVLFTDAEGPRNSYAINRLASHVLLDSMRMVHKQKDFPLRKSHFVSMGVSHGGLQTGYAAAEQPYYAPDLNPYIEQFIINEGAPDFIKLAHSLGLYGDLSKVPSPWAGFLVSFIVGAIREYGDMVPHMEHWLTPYGKTVVKTSRNLCMPFSTVAGGGGLLKYMVKDGFFKSQTFKSMMQIAKDSSSFYYPGVPKAPTLIIHGTTDEILFQADQDKALWQRYCKAGTNTVYQQVPLGTHFTTPVVSAPRMVVQTLLSLNGIRQVPSCEMPMIL